MTIQLTKGQETRVSYEDYLLVRQYKWCATNCAGMGNRSKTKYYAQRTEVINKKRSKVYMHRFIMSQFYDLTSDMIIDHIDGNGLHNTRPNLRVTDRHNNNKPLYIV